MYRTLTSSHVVNKYTYIVRPQVSCDVCDTVYLEYLVVFQFSLIFTDLFELWKLKTWIINDRVLFQGALLQLFMKPS